MPDELKRVPKGSRSAALLAAAVFAMSATFGLAQTWKTWADSFPDPEFETGVKTKHFVVEEVRYIYTVREYAPSVDVIPVPREETSSENPERTAISMISALLAADEEWWRSGWTEEAARRLEEEGTDLATFGWAPDSAFENTTPRLTTRIETGRYVIIAYKLESGDPRLARLEAKEPPRLVVTKEVGGRWLVTDELKGDPVLQYWTNPGVSVRRIER